MSKIKKTKAYIQVYARTRENDPDDLMNNKLIKLFFKLLVVLIINILDWIEPDPAGFITKAYCKYCKCTLIAHKKI